MVICPYIFRQVCRNGSIAPQALDSFDVERVDFSSPTEAVDEVIAELQRAIQCCLDPSVLDTATDEMREAARTRADFDLGLLYIAARVPNNVRERLLASISDRFVSGDDRTLFGLMNAVTSVARDTRDPQIRWRLEELGGGVTALLSPRFKPDSAAAKPACSATV